MLFYAFPMRPYTFISVHKTEPNQKQQEKNHSIQSERLHLMLPICTISIKELLLAVHIIS